MIICRGSLHVVLFALGCLLLLFSPAGALPGDYIVEPLPPGAEMGTPADTVKVEPPAPATPADHFRLFALNNFPDLLTLLEILIIVKLGLYLGYRKLQKKNVLEHSSRSVIYHYIQESPGADFTEISRETGVHENSLRYHLTVLKLMNKVSALETSRNTRYYENSEKYPLIEQKVIRYLRTDPTRRLLLMVKENPGLTRGELETALHISGAGINWHMNRLSGDGILAVRKEGRNARYDLNPDVLPFLEKYLGDDDPARDPYTYE